MDEKIDKSASAKKKDLEQLLKSHGKILVAFSGGVDSTFLLKIAKNVLENNVIAVTLKAPVFPIDESNFAEEFCASEGIEHIVIDVDLLANEDFVANSKERCYLCKKLLFENVLKLGDNLGIENICEGSIVDDDNDYRPGIKALKELGIKSPMKEVGLTKDEIRYLSKEINLPTWDKPSMACLASRFPYGDEITKSKLVMIEEAEKYLFDLGFKQVRVRIHGLVARIEVPDHEISKITAPQIRERLYGKFLSIGFTYVSLDLKGYRTGSMNETL